MAIPRSVGTTYTAYSTRPIQTIRPAKVTQRFIFLHVDPHIGKFALER